MLFKAHGFKGSWGPTYNDMKANIIRVREGKRTSLNKVARRAARNLVRRDTYEQVRDALG